MGFQCKSMWQCELLLAMLILGAPVYASTVSVTMHNPSCFQVPLSGGVCAIQIGSVTAIGSDTSFSRVEVLVDGKLRVFMGGFFETSAYLTDQMVPGGMKVACGLPNASGSLNYGKAYSVATNAYMFDGTSAGASQAVFCPAYITHPITVTSSPAIGGSASCTPNPVEDGGDTVCTSTASAGYVFNSWGGDCAGATCLLINVTVAKSVTANFTPLSVPGTPIILSIISGPEKATINLQNPVNTGGGPIVSYSATCSAAGRSSVTATSNTSTVVVQGLVPGVSYACTATVSNGGYTSTASPPTPVVPKKKTDLTPILMLLLD